MPTVNGIELGPNSPALGLRACRSESVEEALCDALVAMIAGCEAVVKFSQAQAAQQTRGISDRRYRIFGFGLWFEVKAEDGKLTMSQHTFLLNEIGVGELACCGTLQDLKELLALLQPGQQSRAEVLARARAHCLRVIGDWAAKGYRAERPTKRGRR